MCSWLILQYFVKTYDSEDWTETGGIPSIQAAAVY